MGSLHFSADNSILLQTERGRSLCESIVGMSIELLPYFFKVALDAGVAGAAYGSLADASTNAEHSNDGTNNERATNESVG